MRPAGPQQARKTLKIKDTASFGVNRAGCALRFLGHGSPSAWRFSPPRDAIRCRYAGPKIDFFTTSERLLPPRLHKPFAASFKLTFTRDGDKTIPIIAGSRFNCIVTNTEKIRIQRPNARNGRSMRLFGFCQGLMNGAIFMVWRGIQRVQL